MVPYCLSLSIFVVLVSLMRYIEWCMRTTKYDLVDWQVTDNANDIKQHQDHEVNKAPDFKRIGERAKMQGDRSCFVPSCRTPAARRYHRPSRHCPPAVSRVRRTEDGSRLWARAYLESDRIVIQITGGHPVIPSTRVALLAFKVSKPYYRQIVHAHLPGQTENMADEPL